MAGRRELVLALVSDSSQFNKGLDQAERRVKKFGTEAEKSGGGVGKLEGRVRGVRASLGGLAAFTGGAFALDRVKQFAKESVDAFSDLEESANALRVVFGNASDPLEKFGETAARNVGLAASEFNQLAANTGALLQNFGLSAEQAADETIKLTERAADMASVFNTTVPDALQAIGAALRGEQEPIRRYAVSIDDAAARAKAVALGLADTAASADLNARAQARLQLIYEQTNQVAGDFENTSSSLANAQKIAAAEAENLKAIIGEQLAPEYAKLIDIGAELRKSASVLALEFLADAETPAEKARVALAKFSIQTGAATDTAAALATAVLELDAGLEKVDAKTGDRGIEDRTEQLKQLVRQSEISGEELDILAGSLQKLQDEFGLSAGDAQVIADELERMGAEANAAAADVVLLETAHRDLGPIAGQVSSAVKESADAYDEARTEAMRLRDQLRGLEDAQRAARDAFLEAADPAFAAANAMERLRDAEKALADVREDSEASAEDVISAELDLYEARLNTQAALNNLDEASLIRVFDTLAAAMGGSTEDARELLEALGLLDGLTVTTVVETEFRTVGSPPAGSSVGGGGGRVGARARGGPVTGGEPYLVGERGPELFVPESSGQIVPNHQIGGNTNLTQNFYQVPGGNISDDIQRGLLIAGLHGFAEVG